MSPLFGGDNVGFWGRSTLRALPPVYGSRGALSPSSQFSTSLFEAREIVPDLQMKSQLAC